MAYPFHLRVNAFTNEDRERMAKEFERKQRIANKTAKRWRNYVKLKRNARYNTFKRGIENFLSSRFLRFSDKLFISKKLFAPCTYSQFHIWDFLNNLISSFLQVNVSATFFS